jgi:hypothetical protein
VRAASALTLQREQGDVVVGRALAGVAGQVPHQRVDQRIRPRAALRRNGQHRRAQRRPTRWPHQKPGYFRETTNDQAMEKVDEQGNVLGFAVLRVGAPKGKAARSGALT